MVNLAKREFANPCVWPARLRAAASVPRDLPEGDEERDVFGGDREEEPLELDDVVDLGLGAIV